MKRYIVFAIFLTIALSSCQLFNGGAPKGYKHISIDNGKFQFNVPEDFSTRKDTVYHITPPPAQPGTPAPQAYDVKVFKFINTKDTAQMIVFNYSIGFNQKSTIDQVISNVAMLSHNPMVKLKSNDTLQLDGQKYASFGFTKMAGTDEKDYMHVLVTIMNQEIYQLSTQFKGPYKPEYDTEANMVVKSFKLKK